MNPQHNIVSSNEASLSSHSSIPPIARVPNHAWRRPTMNHPSRKRLVDEKEDYTQSGIAAFERMWRMEESRIRLAQKVQQQQETSGCRNPSFGYDHPPSLASLMYDHHSRRQSIVPVSLSRISAIQSPPTPCNGEDDDEDDEDYDDSTSTNVMDMEEVVVEEEDRTMTTTCSPTTAASSSCCAAIAAAAAAVGSEDGDACAVPPPSSIHIRSSSNSTSASSSSPTTPPPHMSFSSLWMFEDELQQEHHHHPATSPPSAFKLKLLELLYFG